MLVSVNWLKDYFQKQDLSFSPKELAEKMTMRGIAVENIRSPSLGLDNVVVGKIIKIEKHPNADKLQVTQVVTSDEEGAETRQIVCGATNIAEGDIVPVALPGAVLPGNFKIKKSKIRGTESLGMLCSGSELKISEDSEGILKLPKHSQLGQSLSRLLGSDDVILEFELTANRGDCLSMMGIAREAAPILKTKVREPKAPRFKVSQHRTSNILRLEVDDEEACPRYVARVLDQLKVSESPTWIQQRLKAVGMNPVNNIVDVTNFVMLEYGQPLHAFDLRKLNSGGVLVAKSKSRQNMELLNGETVEIEPGDILILDGDRPIALAGIMGAANTQVTDDTTSILLESACFDSAQIRKTAKRLGLSTDSSKRFERGVDLQGVAKASDRAASLLRDSVDANVYHPPLDTHEEEPELESLSIDMREVRRLTGLTKLSGEKATEALESVGIPAHKRSVNILNVKIPTFRNDLRLSVDFVEEIARLIGYEVIPENKPLSTASYDRFDDELFEFESRTRQCLSQLGMHETIHYSFTAENTLIQYGVHSDSLVRLENPISEEFKVMRPSLLPSLLQTYIYNKNRRSEGQRLFEVARVYEADDSAETKVKETTHVAGLLSGRCRKQSWRKNDEMIDFYYGKGLLENFIRQMTTVSLAYEANSENKLFHPAHTARLKLGLNNVGYLGEVHPYIRERVLESHEPILLFEFNLDALRKYRRADVRFKTISKYPSVDIDIAIAVNKSFSSRNLSETIRSAGGPLLRTVEVFDIYEGENIPMGKKSIAFRLSFSSPERTLEEKEIHTLRDKIVDALGSKHEAQLR